MKELDKEERRKDEEQRRWMKQRKEEEKRKEEEHREEERRKDEEEHQKRMWIMLEFMKYVRQGIPVPNEFIKAVKISVKGQLSSKSQISFGSDASGPKSHLLF